MDIRHAAPRHSRTLGAVGTGLIAVLLAWSPVLAAVSWGTVYTASNDYAYTSGNALARTVTSGGTAQLHDVFTQYVIGGVEASDSGPYLGIYYRRGNSSGSSWGTAKRLNSTSLHGDHATIAASGRFVHVAWGRQADVNGGGPRKLQFRRNTNYGSSTYWKAQPAFVGADGIDYPSLAVTGSRVWIAYTDVTTGEIRLQKSTNNGETFVSLDAVGATTAVGDGGYSGRAVVAATGNTVAVAFDNGSTFRVRISIDGGASWLVDTDLETNPVQRIDAAASSGKVAFAWTDGEGRHIYERRFNGTSLGARKTVLAVSDSSPYKRVGLPALAMTGSTVMGIAYAACSSTTCSASSTQGLSVRWTESRNSGGTWKPSVTVGSYQSVSSRRINEFPSAIWAGSSKRIVAWTAFGTSSGSKQRLLVRTGTGTP